MRLLVLADIDDLHWHHGGGSADLLLACGDIADAVILEAAQAYRCRQIFAVKGNHDPCRPFPSPVVDLHLNVSPFGDLLFGGFHGAWKYKPRGAFLYTQEEADARLKFFPEVDVMVSHNSPLGTHDRQDDVHAGFQALADYVGRTQPRLLIHGHQHLNRESVCGKTRIVGVYGYRLLEI